MSAEEAVVRLDYVFNEEATATDMFTNRNLESIVPLNGSYETETSRCAAISPTAMVFSASRTCMASW